MEQFLGWAQALGAPGAAIFAFLYWRADAERREIQKLYLQAVPELTAAMIATKGAVDMLRVTMGTKNGNGGGGA